MLHTRGLLPRGDEVFHHDLAPRRNHNKGFLEETTTKVSSHFGSPFNLGVKLQPLKYSIVQLADFRCPNMDSRVSSGSERPKNERNQNRGGAVQHEGQVCGSVGG